MDAKYQAMFRVANWLLVTMAIMASTAAWARQGGEAVKYRLRVQEVKATNALVSSTQGAALASLNQVVAAADTQLLNAIEQTRKFELVPRDPNAVIDEQDFARNGNVSTLDPQAAKSFQMAGVRYIAMVTIDNYQDVTQRMNLEGGLGTTAGERRTIQLQAVVAVVDTTKATVLRSTGFRLEKAAINEVLAGSTVEGGRSTDALIGMMSSELATRAANEITDMLYPAKVVAYTNGLITFNRTKASGASSGQYWQVFHLGPEMTDPDTGESLGAEEVGVGWAVVTSAGDRTSKAEAIVDNGIDRGMIMRSADRLPAGIDPAMRATGSATPSEELGGVRPSSRASAPLEGQSGDAGTRLAEPQSKPEGASEVKTRKYAIFVKNRVKEINDDMVMAMEDQIVAAAIGPNIEIIRREDVANAVSRFATSGANAGTGDPKAQALDRMLSDSTSAVSLAQNLGADYLLVASMSSLESESIDYDDGTTKTKVDRHTLRCTYNILDGGSGVSVNAGVADSQTAMRKTANISIKSNFTTELLNQSGRLIGAEVRKQVAAGRVRAPDPVAADTGVQVNIYLADMRVPRVRRLENGDYAMSNETVDVGVLNCEVLVDGLSVGSAPGTLQIRPGLRRLEVRRPLCVPEFRMVNVKPNMVLQIGIRLTEEGRAQWMENAKFFEQLRAGEVAARTQERLADAEVEKARGFAKFLEKSEFKVNWDVSAWNGLIN